MAAAVVVLDQKIRLAALGGVVGVGGFVSAWVLGGATRSGYSSVDDAISRLAATGSPNRWIMTAGFLAFGLGVPVYAQALRRAVDGPAWISATATGLATLAVAAAPLDSADTAHNVAAVAGYVTLAATPLLAARTFRSQGEQRWAAWSLACGSASALLLAASSIDAGHGATQRLGLGMTDAWIVVSAWTIWRHGRLGAPPE